MNRIILGIFAVGFCFEFVSALVCHKCGLAGTSDDWCTALTLPSNMTCKSGDVCYSTAAKAVLIPYKLKGCIAKEKCGKNETVTFPGTTAKIYHITRTCCETNLCNAASRLPAATLLPLSLATLTTIIMAKMLV